MFEKKTANELVAIAGAGGGFPIKVDTRPRHELVQVAAAASTNGAQIVFTALHTRPQEELVEIAAASKGCVFFDN